eukprot:m.152618 g.152618  ORF g.152618 m.152618 type:complete len:369 (-) comp16217_c2_seq4:1237-2343(-)
MSPLFALLELLTDTASLGMYLLAALTVVFGSRRAVSTPLFAADAGRSHAMSDSESTLSWIHAAVLPVAGSITLLTYYYLYKYFELVLSICLAVLSGSCLFAAILPIMRWIDRCLSSGLSPHAGAVSTVVAFLIAVFVVARWLTTAHWLYTNMLAASLGIFLIGLVRLPSARSAAFLLGGIALYDAFWVYLAPVLFATHVMEDVATQRTDNPLSQLCHAMGFHLDLPSISAPITLEVPSFERPEETAVLGLGDVVLPALFAVYCLRCDASGHRARVFNNRHDTSNLGALKLRWQLYFPRAMIGYSSGLFLAMYVSEMLDSGQPVLLYIVPLMILLPAALARSSGHWAMFWKGTILFDTNLADPACLLDK